MKIDTFGSLCSGIEAASFVLEPLHVHPLWLSEIAEFQSRFLALKYPDIPNLGDMNDIPQMIDEGAVQAPDLICGGTPCQAFSLAGWRKGINDDRGQLTLRYIDIVDSADRKRLEAGKNRTIFFWENVEGALTDKTNAFGCFLAGLAGLDAPLVSPLGIVKTVKEKKKDNKGQIIKDENGNPIIEEITIYPKWSSAGVLLGKDRNIAWRVLDAKYFGLPQQRRRVYVLGGGKDFHPESVLFEKGALFTDPYRKQNNGDALLLFNDEQTNGHNARLTREINGHRIEAFRGYSDCLYAAYGTKWNGNAAAFNGSLFFAQDGRLRRLSPRECERLMGFPDDYTLIEKCRDTQRYQAVGNSWAVPVIRWIAYRLVEQPENPIHLPKASIVEQGVTVYLLDDFTKTQAGQFINASRMPYDYTLADMVDIADTDIPEKFYITPMGCAGILRRKNEHNAGMNSRLEVVLKDCSKDEENT